MTTEKETLNDGAVAEESPENFDGCRLVSAENGCMFTTSLMVAEIFGKNHKDVLKAIDNLECSKEFHERNFALYEYSRDLGIGIRKYPAYTLTRDGFSFLAMGFTGAKAAAWKEKFLEAFNAMEACLLKQQAIDDCGVAYPRLSYSTPKKYPSRKTCTKAQLAAVHGLIDFWCSVEGCSQEYALQHLHTAMRILSLDGLSQSDLMKALSFIWRATFQRTDFSGPPASESAQKALDGLLEAWIFFGENRTNAANYVCLACNAPSLSAISDKDLPKATLAAFMGFMDRLPA